MLDFLMEVAFNDSVSSTIDLSIGHRPNQMSDVGVNLQLYLPATADACGGTMSLRFGALEEPLITAVLKRLFAEPVSFLLTL